MGIFSRKPKFNSGAFAFEVSTTLLAMVLEAFTNQSEPNRGPKWAPTKSGPPILIKTGALRDSFDVNVDESKLTAELYSNVTYAVFANAERRFFPTPNEARSAVTEAILEAGGLI